MMQAAIYETFCGPIRVQSVPIPSVPDDGVLIAVKATGVCRSDWHGWKGHDSDIIQHGLPFCPGHEFSGIIVQLGKDLQSTTTTSSSATTTTTTTTTTNSTTKSDVERPIGGLQIGDRVAVPFILSCGNCHYCSRQEQPTICSHQQQPGFTQWGSFAEFVAVPRAQRNVRRLPPHVSFVQAAALGCRFTTAYRALYEQGQLLVGETQQQQQQQRPKSVAIVGCGGLGLSCILLAATAATSSAPHSTSHSTPRKIIAVDISQKALQKAKTLGATHLVHIQPHQSAQAIAQEILRVSQKFDNDTADGIDLTLDAAGFPLTSEAAVWATRPGGRMVQVGLPSTPPTIPMTRVAGKEITIVGSHGFDAKGLSKLLDLVANRSLDPCQLVEAQVSLEEGCRALEDMDRQSPLGIVMITNFSSTSTNTKSGCPRL